MTPAARLERIERVAMLLVRAGYRARKEFRKQLLEHNRMIQEHDRLIDHMANLQIENEKKFAQNEVRVAQNEERFARNEERFAQNEVRVARNEERFAILAESQVDTDRRLKALIEIVAERHNGGPGSEIKS